MKKEYIGKIIISFGIALIAIPLLTAIIYDISLFFRIGRLGYNIQQNLFGRGSPNGILRWFGSIIYITGFRGNIQLFFQRIFLQNVLLLFIPNLFITFGFCFLLNQNKGIDIKKCFNKIVFIGLAINILILFNFFRLYSIVYNRSKCLI
jgi:hypothetical protein